MSGRGGGSGGGGRGGRGRGGRGMDLSSSSAPSSSSGVSDVSSRVHSLSINDPVAVAPTTTTTTTTTTIPPTLPDVQPISSKAVRPPSRPSFGTRGNKCIVRANHFLVEVADRDLHHYDVAITPEVTSKGVNRAVIRLLIDMYTASHLGTCRPVYDGRKSLYTAGALPFTSKEFVVKLPDKDQIKAARKEREFKVVIKLVGRADLHHLRQFLQGRQSDTAQETIQVLDVVLRESPSANYVTVGRSFFSPKLGNRDSLGDGMECWKGYFQSLRPTQMGLSLNIDTSATSFYKSTKMVDFVCEYLNLRDSSRPLSDSDRIKLKKVLRGLKIETTHIADSRRRYRITGITAVPLSQLKFPIEDQGKMVTVVHYFREKYGISLKQVAWPALQAGSDIRPSYLPMEVCQILEGQKYSKKLNDRQVTAILRATCKRPHEREKNIAEMVKHNNYANDEYALEFGMKVADRLASIEARVLPPPMLKYHQTGREANVRPSVGQWNMINKRMVDGGKVDYWACLNFSRLNNEAVSGFCWELGSMCNNIGMTFQPNPLIETRSVRTDKLQMVLIDVDKQCKARLANQGVVGKQLELLIIVLPDMSGFYGKIKRICETELGIVSQCCQPRNLSKNSKQYLENVSLKINVKVGGRNTVLVDAVQRNIPLVTDKPTIIFGADVTHPQPGEDSSPSIAAVVASMDWPEITKYRGLVSAQPHRQEVIKDLYIQNPREGMAHGGMIKELLIAFEAATGHKPFRIIFYRDGVSEGQFNEVLLNEVTAIRKACQSWVDNYLPPITFVVVQKRHHTRLFPVNPSSTDRSGNILPGTVVDTKICHPTKFDFYLCSHAGIQGTSRPAHYHVLYDENRFTADGLQSLTNNMCYTYARCTRSVSVVPPAYYAHLLAFRARYYIEGDTSDGASTLSAGGNSRGTPAAVRPLPVIKDNVKDVMFYC